MWRPPDNIYKSPLIPMGFRKNLSRNTWLACSFLPLSDGRGNPCVWPLKSVKELGLQETGLPASENLWYYWKWRRGCVHFCLAGTCDFQIGQSSKWSSVTYPDCYTGFTTPHHATLRLTPVHIWRGYSLLLSVYCYYRLLLFTFFRLHLPNAQNSAREQTLFFSFCSIFAAH